MPRPTQPCKAPTRFRTLAAVDAARSQRPALCHHHRASLVEAMPTTGRRYPDTPPSQAPGAPIIGDATHGGAREPLVGSSAWASSAQVVNAAPEPAAPVDRRDAAPAQRFATATRARQQRGRRPITPEVPEAPGLDWQRLQADWPWQWLKNASAPPRPRMTATRRFGDVEGLRCAFIEHRFRSMAFPSVSSPPGIAGPPAACRLLAGAAPGASARALGHAAGVVGEGDLDVAALDLVTTLSSDGQWLPPALHRAGWRCAHPDGALLWVDGHLRLQRGGTDGRLALHLPARLNHRARRACAGDGRCQVHCALLRQGQLHVGNLSVHIAVGRWRAGRPHGAGPIPPVGLFTRGYAPQWNQPPSFDFTLQDADPAGDSALGSQRTMKRWAW